MSEREMFESLCSVSCDGVKRSFVRYVFENGVTSEGYLCPRTDDAWMVWKIAIFEVTHHLTPAIDQVNTSNHNSVMFEYIENRIEEEMTRFRNELRIKEGSLWG